MRTLLLNLPHPTPVVRRYMCSYNAPNIMFPPLELLALGGIVKRWKQDEVFLIDAVAEKQSIEDVERFISDRSPDIVVTISGFECFEEDMALLSRLKNGFPEVRMVLFGHYATVFWREIMDRVPVDHIVLGEPDLKFSSLYDHIKVGTAPENIHGVVFRKDDQVVNNGNDLRIPDPNELPIPAYELLKIDRYFEPFMESPFCMVQTARGCPYQCNYCVKSYGTKLTTLRPQRIIEELKLLKELFNIRSVRFIDDTFTAVRKNVLQLCDLMEEHGLEISWSCLTRPDTIDRELVERMKAAGCKRIFFGVESGSQRVLDNYKKGMTIRGLTEPLLACKTVGIETVGWFMVGQPGETREDLMASISFAKKAKFDYILVSKFLPYPGTPIFETVKADLDFSLFPYRNEWRDEGREQVFHEWEREFFRRFYFRPSYILSSAMRLTAHPWESVSNLLSLTRFITGMTGNGKRKDFA